MSAVPLPAQESRGRSAAEISEGCAAASIPRWGELRRRPLPYEPRTTTRWLCRAITGVATGRVRRLTGVENVAIDNDPFVFVCNHSQRTEALILPTILIFHRGGKQIHFLADWPILLIPVVASALRRNGAIIVGGKDARIKLLNVFRKVLAPHPSPLAEAKRRLQQGSSVGIFPEGIMNRNARQLLPGSPAAARLSLECGVPVVPAGIHFPGHDPAQPIPDRAPMAVAIGAPMRPPQMTTQRPPRDLVRQWHDRIMGAISELCGKQYSAPLRVSLPSGPGADADAAV